MAKDITILFISDSDSLRERLRSIIPVGVTPVFSDFSPTGLREALYSHKPSGIYIVFAKGERAGTKNLTDIFSYVRGSGIKLAVTGSYPQFRSVREMYGEDSISHIKEAELRRSIIDLRNSITDTRKNSKDKKIYTVAAITSDITIAALCEDAFSLAHRSGIRFICSDIGCYPSGVKGKASVTPDLLLITEDIVSEIKKSFGEIPYILLETGGYSESEPEYEPCCRIDISKNNFSLRSVTESILKEL